jgi:integrase
MVAETTWRALLSVEGLRKGEAPDLPRVRPVPLKHVEAIRPFVSPVIWGLIQFQLHTGCRPGEACMIRMCDLTKLDAAVWEYRPESHKTEHHDKERVIHIGPKAQAALKPFLRVETHAPLFQPRESREWYLAQRRVRDASHRRTSRPKRKPGEQYTASSLGQAIRKACAKAKIPNWHPNQLRHTAATLIRSKFSLDASRVALGHSKASTAEIYAAEDRKKARRVARKLG